jgi:formiminoglutamate deiminase
VTDTPASRRYFAQRAWLGGPVATEHVLIETDDGTITAVQAGAQRPPDAVALDGLVLPGFANAHSHAFHRALRGHTHRGGGSFWTWRADMYKVAANLTPDTYFELARATYAEMALSGITCVGEFHYLHHRAGGKRYEDANVFGLALVQAAKDAGIRITLLDTCYLAGGIGRALEGPQLRFGDGDAVRWGSRAQALRAQPHARIGAAIHSVRAVPAEQLSTVAGWAREREVPLHFHVSEQRAENEACLAAHGRTPVALLEQKGALGAGSTAVHATHLTSDDITALTGSHTTVCMCPSTERDLADGIGPARALASGGAPLSLGSDSHAVIDIFEEARALELDERLATQTRGHFGAEEILAAATAEGHASLGWPQAGRIAPGAPADLVAVSLGSVALAGHRPETVLESVIFSAGARDVTDVIVDGRHVVSGSRHQLIPDVSTELQRAIEAVSG